MAKDAPLIKWLNSCKQSLHVCDGIIEVVKAHWTGGLDCRRLAVFIVLTEPIEHLTHDPAVLSIAAKASTYGSKTIYFQVLAHMSSHSKDHDFPCLIDLASFTS